ncbi:nucleoside triphosphate pyrophosphohydrolase [Salinicola aestuarinus]|uniref:nucleoside triphosphate pyrophosphohydrolase n=1 Tax=Salinicola aestuarinus TaxID=1949082 RepID=UPI000DA1201E|nr:nucleoside triphosphate pyrophosphohydrolase [Salinicola aestuarinus]
MAKAAADTPGSDTGHRYTLDDLLTLMGRLRADDGCPWDRRQNWESIVPHTVEEAYEVADAIERHAFAELPGELGDLLFQVVYYAQLGREEARFDFHDIVDTLTAKMIRRHPHVFPGGTLASRRADGELSESEIKARWEALKAEERAARGEATRAVSALDDVPTTLPALSRAAKLGKRAAGQGFDWEDERGAIAKIREELAEVEAELDSGDRQAAREEVGDLLFAVVNLSRQLGGDPEQLLRGTNAKFERRFRHVESAIDAEGRLLDGATLEEMEQHWRAAKRLETSPHRG